MVLCELAEALIDRGMQVTVLCNAQADLVAAPLVARGVRVTDDPDNITLAKFDLVYCQHQLVSLLIPGAIAALLARPDRLPVFVYNHLSPFEAFETPGPFVEAALADIILCNSDETRAQLDLYDAPFDDAVLFPNPAPDRFLCDNPVPQGRLTRLLAVSNHMPEEVSAALALLEQDGITVTRIGRKYDHRRLTPADIAGHDAVLTIGKTVQYALAGRRAVFCYDKFAGPGWITAANFAAAAKANFSGRSDTRPRSPEQLAQELIAGFGGATSFAKDLKRDHLTPYLLTPQLDVLLAKALLIAEDDGLQATKRAHLQHLATTGQALREERLYALIRREFLGRHHLQQHVRAQAKAAMSSRDVKTHPSRGVGD